MPRAATPASRNPGFRPMRGSLASAGFCCAIAVVAEGRESGNRRRFCNPPADAAELLRRGVTP